MQHWIVALIVGYAFWAVAARYAPKALKRALRSRLARVARRYGWDRLALRLQTEAANGTAGCADGCGSCGACATDVPVATTETSQRVIPIKVESQASR
jgi:hypothetical protein